jgi:hypothetical protein
MSLLRIVFPILVTTVIFLTHISTIFLLTDHTNVYAQTTHSLQYKNLNKTASNNRIISQILAHNNKTTATFSSLSSHSQSEKKPIATSPISIIGRLTEGNLSSTPSARLSLNRTYYTLSPDRHEISTPENNSHTGEFGKGVKIALVKPTFTAAAYSCCKFYEFFNLYDKTPAGKNITTDLDKLTAIVPDQNESSSAFAMLDLLSNIKWVTPDSNISVITDADVDKGLIFAKDSNLKNFSNNNAYDVIILGHQEYVTQKEYDNLRKFVVNGGTMIILDGNVFYTEVKYDSQKNTVTLVKGHWWAYNGKSAWKSVAERWRNETAQWVGSNYLCYICVQTFANDPFGYKPHEEQYITNPHDIILLNYNASIESNLPISNLRHVIATYELNYGRGKVIALGIYSDDIITNGKFQRFLDSLIVRYSPIIKL